MQNLESLLPSLVDSTVEAAGLTDEWKDVFRPLFVIERLSRDGEDEIAITFKYLGATSYFPFTSDRRALADAIAEAAASFGHSLRWERDTYGSLRVPVSGDTTADGSPKDGRVEAAFTERGEGRIRLRPRWSPARKLGVGVIVLGGVFVAVLLLTILGYLLAEEDEPMHLLVSGLLLGGIAAVLILLGVRLLSARG